MSYLDEGPFFFAKGEDQRVSDGCVGCVRKISRRSIFAREERVGGVAGSRVIGGEAEKLSGTDHKTLRLAFYSKWHSKPFKNCVKRGDRVYLKLIR